MIDFVIGHFNVVTYVVLMMIGFYAMTGKANLIKKLVGMNIFQWSIILFFVSLGAKRGATIPIVLQSSQTLDHATEPVIAAAQYANPLPGAVPPSLGVNAALFQGGEQGGKQCKQVQNNNTNNGNRFVLPS